MESGGGVGRWDRSVGSGGGIGRCGRAVGSGGKVVWPSSVSGSCRAATHEHQRAHIRWWELQLHHRLLVRRARCRVAQPFRRRPLPERLPGPRWPLRPGPPDPRWPLRPGPRTLVLVSARTQQITFFDPPRGNGTDEIRDGQSSVITSKHIRYA